MSVSREHAEPSIGGVVARIPEGRDPARAENPDQVMRRERLLEVAADLGERDGLERVQMTEIAKTAGVAVGTLYRYFPSKTQLFEILLFETIRRFVEAWEPAASADPLDELSDQLVQLTRRFAGRPRLAIAMVRCATSGYPDTSEADLMEQQNPLISSILRAVGIDTPSEQEFDKAQLLLYAWWSVTVAIVSGASERARGEEQIRTAVRMILKPCECWRPGGGPADDATTAA